jgi:ATP-binding cassette, subfamily B, bacterial PglK
VIDPFTATVAATVMGVLYVGASLATARKLLVISDVIATSLDARIKAVQEGLGGIRDILLEQSQPIFEETFRRIDRAYRTAQTHSLFIQSSPRFIVEAAGIVLIALLTVYMSFQPGGVTAAIPVLGALAVGAQRLLPLLQSAYSGWSLFAGNAQLLVDVAALLRTPMVSTAPIDASTAAPLEQDIVFDEVSFQYDTREYALRGVTLGIPQGGRIGFIGATGSGKSTLMDLLMGLLTPTAGEIRIDGKRLDDANRASWQAQIAHVPQAIYLSDSSIASNIAFGEEPGEIDIDRVRAAARQAEIDEFIVGLPQGYETRVGERGVRLSGGQRQRIGIARALYKRARVLVLDEATSALDDNTEAAIIRSISALGRNLTVIMIAHRLSTLVDCDQIVRLEGGRVAETGTYKVLIGDQPVPLRAGGAP